MVPGVSPKVLGGYLKWWARIPATSGRAPGASSSRASQRAGRHGLRTTRVIPVVVLEPGR